MAVYPSFPVGPKRFSEVWRLAGQSRTGGQTLSGAQQFGSSPGGRWTAKLMFHLIRDQHYLDVRGFLASLKGQFSPFYVGPVDWRGQPWNVSITGVPVTPGRAAAAARRDPVFQVNPDTTGLLDFRLAANASMNSTTINVLRNKGGFLRRGQYLQIGDRLHVIANVTSAEVFAQNGQAAPGTVTIQIEPWLRVDYAAGTVLNFESPQGLMRLSSPDQGGVEMTTSPQSDLSLDLVEAF